MLLGRCFEGGILSGVACVTRQALGPEAIGESPKDTFEHGKQGCNAHSGALQRNGHQRITFQVATHQHNGSAAGDRKDKAERRFDRLPQQMHPQVGDGFDVSIERTRGVDKLLLVGLEDLCELDGLAVWGGRPRAGGAGGGAGS